jgi:ATP-binding protein involved in chromosome partitioning
METVLTTMTRDPMARARLRAKHVLMMISAKGGVGKSTLTVNIAAALKAQGLSVGIFDADIHAPDVPALLGVRQKRRLDGGPNPEAMLPVDARPDAMDMRPLQPFERYGLRLMSLGLMVGETQAITPSSRDLGVLTAMLMTRVTWDVDVLLVDMPPGTGEPLTTLLGHSLVDGAVIVTTRERLAHLDNGRLMTVFQRNRVPVLGVIENQTHIVCPRCGELIELYPMPASEQDTYAGMPVLGAIPFHPGLIRGRRGGVPLALAERIDPADAPVQAALLEAAQAVQARFGVAKPGSSVTIARLNLHDDEDRPDDCETC